MKEAGLAGRDLHFHGLRGTAAFKFFFESFIVQIQRLVPLVLGSLSRNEFMTLRLRGKINVQELIGHDINASGA
jgi:hypothetical protein